MALNWRTEYHRYNRYFVDIGRFYRQKKLRVYTGIIVSILAVCFFLFFAIRPTAITISRLLKTIDDQKLVSKRLNEKISSLSQAQAEYNLVGNELVLIDEALPKDPQLGLLARQIEALAAKGGVTIGTVRFDSVYLKKPVNFSSTEKGKTGVGLSITAGGDYAQLKSFLQSLASVRRVVEINSFSFQSQNDQQNPEAQAGAVSNQLILNINANAHFLEIQGAVIPILKTNE